MGRRGICGEQLYLHFFTNGHSDLTDISLQVIDYMDTRDPTVRQGFWVYKINYFAPLGLNSMGI